MLKNKTYIVSHATTPLGRKISMMLAQLNANVILTGTEYSDLQHLVEDLNEQTMGKHQVFILDETKEIDWLHVMDELKETSFSLSGIINAHTIYTETQSIYDVTFKEFSENMDHHVWGIYLGMRVLRPLLESQSNSSIINIIEPCEDNVYETNIFNTVVGAIEALGRSTAIDLEKESIGIYTIKYHPPLSSDQIEATNEKAVQIIKQIVLNDHHYLSGDSINLN